MKTTSEKPRKIKTQGTRKFHIDCYPYIFSDEEREVLELKGHHLRMIAEEKIKPVGKEERRFLRLCQGKINAFSIMEVAWLKYCDRHEIESNFHKVEDNYQEFLATGIS